MATPTNPLFQKSSKIDKRLLQERQMNAQIMSQDKSSSMARLKQPLPPPGASSSSKMQSVSYGQGTKP